jgi:hypothetical protein
MLLKANVKVGGEANAKSKVEMAIKVMVSPMTMPLSILMVLPNSVSEWRSK